MSLTGWEHVLRRSYLNESRESHHKKQKRHHVVRSSVLFQNYEANLLSPIVRLIDNNRCS